MSMITKPFGWALRRIGLYWPILLARDSGLEKAGWFLAAQARASIDRNGKPIPWITYPAISFLASRIPMDAIVFEFGCGNSTLWWSSRCLSVTACEHDPSWAKAITGRAPNNATVILAGDSADYENTLTQDRRADIIVIDGIRRVKCLETARQCVTARGIIILDNAERPEYAESIKTLHASGFRSIDFWGMSPGNLYESCTLIFYKDKNLLNL